MNIQHIARPLEIKSLGADGTFCGYASVFEKLDSQNEIVAPGAFRRSILGWSSRGAAPAMLWMHDPSQPIGIWLSIAEDKDGLAVEGKLALGTQKGREAYELVKMGALTGLSIGYRVVRSQVDSKRKARVLTDVELFEISLVTFPANDAARISFVKQSKKKPNGKTRKTANAKNDAHATRAVVARLHKAARALQQHSARRV